MEQKGKKPQKQKEKQSMGKNRMETWKEEIWDITDLSYTRDPKEI